MVTQNFVGDKPVDNFPPGAIRKIPDDELTKRELERLSKGADKEPGANKRAGVATRDPARTSIHPTLSLCVDLRTQQSLTLDIAEVKGTIYLPKVYGFM